MKQLKLIALLICLTVIVCSFAGCAKTAPLSFELNGGTLSGEAPVEFKNDADLALPEATKQYYKFEGWSLSSDGKNVLEGNKLPAEMELTDEQVEGGLKLYAVWTRLTGKIEYDLAEGAWDDAAGVASYNYGDEVELPTELSRENFEFVAWTLNGEKIETLPKSQTGDIKLVATWVQVKTPIKFELGRADAEFDAEETFPTNSGCDLTDIFFIPSAPGCIFAGWYTNAECTGEAVTEIEPGTTEAVTLYAKWAEAPPLSGDNWVPVQ